MTVPHTGVVKTCHKCRGNGGMTCGECYGKVRKANNLAKQRSNINKFLRLRYFLVDTEMTDCYEMQCNTKGNVALITLSYEYKYDWCLHHT